MGVRVSHLAVALRVDAIPAVVPEETADQWGGADGVEYVGVYEPVLEGLAFYDSGRGVVEDVEAARHVVAAVAVRRAAVAVAVREARRLLLAVVELRAVGLVDGIALLAGPRALRLELDVPGGLSPRGTSA